MFDVRFEPEALSCHALLDSGGGEKLERFGDWVLRRPDPQALWRRRASAADWDAADLVFERESDRGGRWVPGSGRRSKGAGPPPESWTVALHDARLLIRPTPFKHVGLFPEQAPHWRFLRERADELRGRATDPDGAPRLLNLFGYTGAASVLAALAGYRVTHVDASKTAVAWARENAALSGLSERAIRFLVEDAPVFVRREVRRGSRYAAILVDPPHYGRGPKGENWQFEEAIAPLLEACADLLEERAVFVLSTYAIGTSPLALHHLVLDALGEASVQSSELALREAEVGPGRPRSLPAGFSTRWTRGLEERA